MTVADLRAVIALDMVCIYESSHEVEDPFEDLYVGMAHDIPVELMGREVLVVSGRHPHWLDIGVKND